MPSSYHIHSPLADWVTDNKLYSPIKEIARLLFVLCEHPVVEIRELVDLIFVLAGLTVR